MTDTIFPAGCFQGKPVFPNCLEMRSPCQEKDILITAGCLAKFSAKITAYASGAYDANVMNYHLSPFPFYLKDFYEICQGNGFL
jgi:hypothetical protein